MIIKGLTAIKARLNYHGHSSPRFDYRDYVPPAYGEDVGDDDYWLAISWLPNR